MFGSSVERYENTRERSSLQNQQMKELEERFTIVHPTIPCSCSAKMTYLCSNPTCTQYALFCGNQQCSASQHHQKCERSQLRDVTQLMQSRSRELKEFMQRFFRIQNKLIDSALARRQRYLEEVYFSGLEPRQMDIIETIYFNKKTTTEVEGCYADDLEEELRTSNDFISNALKKDHLFNYEQELDRMTYQMERLERVIFDNLIENRQLQSLEISKYGYYDITSAMMNLSHNERRIVSDLTIANTCNYIERFRRTQLMMSEQKEMILQLQHIKLQQRIIDQTLRCISILYDNEYFLKQRYRTFVEKDRSRYKVRVNKGEMDEFVKELSKFNNLEVLNLRVSHEFNDYDCFNNLADIINRKLLRLKELNVYVGKDISQEKHINWADRLRKNIRVSIKEFARQGLNSRVVAVR